jgi:hypothetical protein
MSESSDTRDLCAQLKKFNAVVYAVVGSQFAHPGWPDRYVHHRYWCGWLEFKAPKGSLSKLQREVIHKLNELKPGSAFVVRHPDSVEDCDGRVLAEFSSAHDLLLKLRDLT